MPVLHTILFVPWISNALNSLDSDLLQKQGEGRISLQDEGRISLQGEFGFLGREQGSDLEAVSRSPCLPGGQGHLQLRGLGCGHPGALLSTPSPLPFGKIMTFFPKLGNKNFLFQNQLWS